MAKLWLCRDGNSGEQAGYIICTTKPSWDERFKYWTGTLEVGDKVSEVPNISCIIRPRNFERLYPHIKIEPGGGPVEVDILIGRAVK